MGGWDAGGNDRWSPGVEETPAIGVDGQFGPGTARTLDLLGGAGGPDSHAGDYLYQETKQRRRLESGLWGIFRVHEANDATDTVQPLPDRAADVSLAARPGYTVETGADLTGSGESDVVVGVPDSDLGAANAGGVYLFEDASPETVTHLADADLVLLGETPGGRAGETLTTVERTADAGTDLRVGTTAGEVTLAGGAALREQIDRASKPDASALAAFLCGALPVDGWPVLPLTTARKPK